LCKIKKIAGFIHLAGAFLPLEATYKVFKKSLIGNSGLLAEGGFAFGDHYGG